ncbi:hypothetical protein ACIHCX_03325 [Streptomyces sp. NPDC052043]|uniref:hypothetical protein n=1 Tax=Streptomyces sp. NPDC052043 TaxID=3365684 RepID=UPI0037CE11BC
MPKEWQPRDEKKFARQVELGKPYWVIADIDTSRARFEDDQMCRVYVFTERSRLTGTPRTEGGMTATELCRNWGPVYDTRPADMRAFGEPLSRVGAPLGRNHSAPLDEAEIRALEKLAAQGEDPRTRRIGGWRV